MAANADSGGVGGGGSALLPGGVATGATWELTDALGSVIAQASGDTITQTAWYDPWGGQDLTTTAGWDSDHGYTSQITDTGLGEVLFYARTYDPTTGTFTSLDPWDGLLTEPGTLNAYAYVLNDPLSAVDVLGYWPGWLDNVARGVTDWTKDNWRTVAGDAAGAVVAVAVGACIVGTGGLCAGGVAVVAGAMSSGGLAGAAAAVGIGAAGAAAQYAVTGNNGHYSWSGAASATGQGALYGAALGGLGYGISQGLRNVNTLTTVHQRPTAASRISQNRTQGNAAQDAANRGIGGQPEQYRPTSLGGRFFDILRGTQAWEIKTGRISLTSSIRQQVMKDAELLAEKEVTSERYSCHQPSR